MFLKKDLLANGFIIQIVFWLSCSP